jgi:L-lactate dehydrogenase complex protein LldG
MKESTNREQILSSIRNALIEVSEIPFPDIDMGGEVFAKHDDSDGIEVVFARELIAVGGKFVYSENEKAFLEFLHDLMNKNNWPPIWCTTERISNLLNAGNIPNVTDAPENVILGMSTCEKLIARTGSVLVSSSDTRDRRVWALPDVHLVIAYSSQVVLSLKEALADLKVKQKGSFPSQITLITGPSRTADIEKTLVMGAHGPKELYVFMIDDF